MHLLYARFWTKVLYDAGMVSFVEPFKQLRNQGMMLAWTPGYVPKPDEKDVELNAEGIPEWKAIKPEDLPSFDPKDVIWRWAKMSKSAGNVVTPDDAAEKYGADGLRVYEMFVAPFEETVQWSENAVVGSGKFLARVYRLAAGVAPQWSADWRDRLADLSPKDKALRRKTHQSILKIQDDLENFRFNTAVAGLMEWVNSCYEVYNDLPKGVRSAALDEAVEMLVQVIAPFAPHLADELWTEGLGQTGFLYKHPWPEADPEVAKNDEITLIVQINGKVRDKLIAPADATNEQLEAMARGSSRLAEFTGGKEIKKVIVVPGRLVNIVVG